MMGLRGPADLMLEDEGGGAAPASSAISCSICLDAIQYNGNRSTAKLQCGHEFHLDCIGSAFNAKELMQCPNCRKIEKGQWLYANGYRPAPEYNVDDWTYDEDLYDMSYSEMPLGFHWCPFSGMTRLSSFEEEEPASTPYHDLGNHPAIFTETSAAPSASHSCPYMAYIQPIQPSSSSESSGNTADASSFHHHHSHHQNWSSRLGGDHLTPHTFSGGDLNYHTWEHLSPPFSSPNGQAVGAERSLSSGPLRSSRPDFDGLARGTLAHPFHHSRGSGPRTSSSLVTTPHVANSGEHPHIRAFGPHQHQSNASSIQLPVVSHARRSTSGRGLWPSGRAPSSSGHSGFYVYQSSGSPSWNIQDPENLSGNGLYAWECDRLAPYPLVPVDRESSSWSAFGQGTGGPDSSRSGYYHRHGAERSSSESRIENPSYQPLYLGQMHPFI